MPGADQNSASAFLARYPDDAACLDHLWRLYVSPDGHTAPCPKCKTTRRFRRVTGKRSYACATCRHHLYPTAGTIFHKSTVPLRRWFHAIFLLTRTGQDVSIRSLERELGVNYKTAARMSALIKAEIGTSFFDPPVVRAPAAVSLDVLGDLSEFAGTGEVVADGGLAAETPLTGLHGIATDATGAVYIADSRNHLVRKVDPSGTISTVAGYGTPGYSGDGGPARRAQLNCPFGVAVDNAGDLLIADSRNHVVRKVDDSGRIHTVAGVGLAGHSGDGGPAVAARLHGCYRVLAVGGDLLISEYSGNDVRRVDAAGIITTIVGNGTRVTSGDGGDALHAGVPRPLGLALDGAGNLFVAQGDEFSPNSRVRRIDPSGVITTFAGTGEAGFDGDGGPAAGARLNNPVDVVIDPSGAVLISDCLNGRVRMVHSSGTITTVAGGPGAPGLLRFPLGLAVTAGGDLLVADGGANRICKLSTVVQARRGG